MVKNGILAILRGPFGTEGDNFNGYSATKKSWENAKNDELLKKKVENGGILGRLDHTNGHLEENPNDETLLKEACISIPEFPKRQPDGRWVGEVKILDTEDGRIAYVLAKAGHKLGISYRGGINGDKLQDGDVEGAWAEFTIEGFDLVYVPAYEEAYLELVEDYGDVKASRNLNANIVKVAASVDERKRMVKVLANMGVNDILDANKELAKKIGDEDLKNKAKKITKKVEINPKHLAPKQEGNMLPNSHDIATDNKEDVITNKPIDELTKMNESEDHVKVKPLKEMVENIHEGKKASIEDKAKQVIKETAKKIIDEEIEAGIKMGMAASNPKEEQEGTLDDEGLKLKKDKKDVTADIGVVAADEEIDDIESLEDNSSYALMSEIQRLSDSVTQFAAKVEELTDELNNRNSEFESLSASHTRLKRTTAAMVDRQQTHQSKMEIVERKASRDLKELQSEIHDQQQVIAQLEQANATQAKSIRVRAEAMQKVERDRQVLTSKNDTFGKVAINAIAEVYGVSVDKLLAHRREIKNARDLDRVIASLQNKRPTRAERTIIEDAPSSIPQELQELIDLYENY